MSLGWLAERSNAAVLKTVEGATLPGVRIPHHPPENQMPHNGVFFLFSAWIKNLKNLSF